MKVRIIGYSGSGKTTLAKEIKDSYNLKAIHLDRYLKEKELPLRKQKLHKSIQKGKGNWIVEGVQVVNWTSESINKADIIIFLDYPLYVVQYRVLKRGLERAFAKDKTFKQRLKSIKRVKSLWKWNLDFKNRIPRIKSNIYRVNTKFILIKSHKSHFRIYKELEDMQEEIKTRKRVNKTWQVKQSK